MPVRETQFSRVEVELCPSINLINVPRNADELIVEIDGDDGARTVLSVTEVAELYIMLEVWLSLHGFVRGAEGVRQ